MDEDLDLIIGFLNQKKEKQGGTDDDSLPAAVEAAKDGPSPFNTRKQRVELPKQPNSQLTSNMGHQTSIGSTVNEEQSGQVLFAQSGEG